MLDSDVPLAAGEIVLARPYYCKAPFISYVHDCYFRYQAERLCTLHRACMLAIARLNYSAFELH
jgi:hypothetical protein